MVPFLHSAVISKSISRRCRVSQRCEFFHLLFQLLSLVCNTHVCGKPSALAGRTEPAARPTLLISRPAVTRPPPVGPAGGGGGGAGPRPIPSFSLPLLLLLLLTLREPANFVDRCASIYFSPPVSCSLYECWECCKEGSRPCL